MALIRVDGLGKQFPVPVKDPGLRGTLKHLFRRTYRTIEAVRDVTFEIEAGEMVGFLGPNGAGKTTTLKMLSGLIHPSQGSVSVAGFRPSDRHRDFLRQITLVMGQKEQLIWDIPALDALQINGAIYEIPPPEFQRRVGELSEMLGLKDQLRQPIRKLSLGERMKAELLAALLHRPSILFLDEPTLGLDVNAQAAVRESLREYNQRYKATILLTSHYMADITALSDRVLLIHQGKLIFDGPIQALLARFAPYREVTVELERPVDPETLSTYGDLESLVGRQARFNIRQDVLTGSVARLLAQLPVTDLTVTEPPVEGVIARVFAAGSVS